MKCSQSETLFSEADHRNVPSAGAGLEETPGAGQRQARPGLGEGAGLDGRRRRGGRGGAGLGGPARGWPRLRTGDMTRF